MDTPLETQPRRFYDGGPAGGRPDPTAPPLIVLERTLDMDVDEFHMGRRLAYRDRELGQLLVPVDMTTFSTDLTSVPSIFLWLVPRLGRHLPAALLHDGLVSGSFTAAPGVTIDRERADLVFRAAMADTGTGLIRRWLMWTAVTLGTIFRDRSTMWSAAERLRWRVTAVGTLALTALLGVIATLDLFDAERVWWVELITGAIGAVVVPLLLGLLWGRFRAAGMIAGVALALLLHVTAAVALLTGVYQIAERPVTRATPEET
ncbi:DUF1353 domain-containing protein [Janibacter limosus]|uniref:DUF1353 domain-containing protein n=1 Tax=Janibacter limosus TaxID=53458 RepID=UPI0035DE74E2|nr:DUF1353 domain-containing protein [Janibacter limosus]